MIHTSIPGAPYFPVSTKKILNVWVASDVLFGGKMRTSQIALRHCSKRGSGARSVCKILVKGSSDAIKHLLYWRFSASHKGFSITRDASIRVMNQKISNCLKTCPTFLEQSASFSTLNSPQVCWKLSAAAGAGFSLCRRQMANALFYSVTVDACEVPVSNTSLLPCWLPWVEVRVCDFRGQIIKGVVISAIVTWTAYPGGLPPMPEGQWSGPKERSCREELSLQPTASIGLLPCEGSSR